MSSFGCLLICLATNPYPTAILFPCSDPEKAETQHSQSMEPYTHLLTNPTTTWSNALNLHLSISHRDSHADTKSGRICIKHLLHLTLAFNETANVHLDFPAVICGEARAPEPTTRRDSANDHSDAAEYIDEKLISSI